MVKSWLRSRTTPRLICNQPGKPSNCCNGSLPQQQVMPTHPFGHHLAGLVEGQTILSQCRESSFGRGRLPRATHSSSDQQRRHGLWEVRIQRLEDPAQYMPILRASGLCAGDCSCLNLKVTLGIQAGCSGAASSMNAILSILIICQADELLDLAE